MIFYSIIRLFSLKLKNLRKNRLFEAFEIEKAAKRGKNEVMFKKFPIHRFMMKNDEIKNQFYSGNEQDDDKWNCLSTRKNCDRK